MYAEISLWGIMAYKRHSVTNMQPSSDLQLGTSLCMYADAIMVCLTMYLYCGVLMPGIMSVTLFRTYALAQHYGCLVH